jgi:hypothetical protein
LFHYSALTSFHPNDSLAAARRLANYWMKRKEVFEERAFLPINLSDNGPMTRDDVKLLQTGFCVNLPRDEKNRTVIYIDISKRPPETAPSRRIMFFVFQFFMENVMSRTDTGFTILLNASNPHAVSFQKSNHECIQSLMSECMPLKNFRVYLIYISPPGTRPMPLFINTGEFFLLLHTSKFVFAGESRTNLPFLLFALCACVQFSHGQ